MVLNKSIIKQNLELTLNITILSQRIPYPPNKGEKIRTYFQIKHLLEQGHTIELFTLFHDKNDANLSQEFVKKHKVSVTINTLPFSIIRYAQGLLKNTSLSESYFYSKKLQNSFDSHIAKNNTDLVLCTSSSMTAYIFNSKTNLIKNNKKFPLLFTDFMDLDSDKWLQYASSSNYLYKKIYYREARLLAKLELKITNSFHETFFISQNEINLFTKNIGHSNNIHVLGNGIDTSEFYPANQKPINKNPIFIFTGVMDYKPNIDAVMWFVKNAWINIIKHYPDSRFIIAGMNPSPEVQSLKSNINIEVTGFVDDILPYYHKADYFVAPFTIARGVQNKILQAFACGLPVLSSPMGAEGIEYTINEDIILVETGEDYLNAVNKLEADTKFKTKICANALTLIQENYSWPGKLKALDRIIHNSLNKKEI